MSLPHEMTTPPANTPWVEGKTIGQVLRATAAKHPDQGAVVFRQHRFGASWGEFDRLVDDAARGLIALGLERGEHLAVWCTNHPQWLVLQFATARAGVVLVTVNPAYRGHELDYALRQSDAKALALTERFRDSDYFDILAQVCPDLAHALPGALTSDRFPRLRWVIALANAAPPGMLAWSDLLAKGRDTPMAALQQREATLDPADPINVQYTSGTTGFPKGAMLTHRNLLLNAYYIGRCQRITHDDRMCIPVPFYHCFGCVLGTLCAAVHGAVMVFPHETFDPGKTLDAVEQERCTVLYGVPTMFIAQLEHPSFAGRDLSSLRTGIMAGAPCPLALMTRVTQTMGCREITIAYGQTETSPVITQTRWDDPIDVRVGTVGRPLPGVEVKIVDVATGAPAPAGHQGELCARGHVVMKGYYNMPEQTAKTIDADGWLHTGDLAVFLESNGCYRITGRLKDMIIRGGENIYPREIEEFLYQHPKIQEAQIVGVPDAKYGEAILAWIKLRAGQTATDHEIRAYCREHLAHFKTPRYIKFVDAFPMTVTGKIQKFKIRQQAIQELGLEDVAKIQTA